MEIEVALDAYARQLVGDGRSPHTVAQARRHVLLLTAWLAATGRSCAVEDITHEDVACFLGSPLVMQRSDGRPRKPTSANALRSSLRCFLGFVHAAGYAASNAGRLVRRAVCGPPPPKALSDVDQAKLLGALEQAATPAERRDRVLFELLLRAGPRVGSVLAAQVEDLDLGAAELHLRREKGRRERVLVLPERVVELLRQHVGDRTSGHLFPGSHRAALTGRHVARRLEGWCERAGIRPISPHVLRHTFATAVYRRTGDVLLTGEALGHANLASTAVYARTSRERLRAVVGA